MKDTSVNRIKPIMELLNYEMQQDSDLAWAWQCNLAMAFYDHGGTHEQANRAAARFMHNLFAVDTSKFPEFLDFEEDWREAVNIDVPCETELGMPEFAVDWNEYEQIMDAWERYDSGFSSRSGFSVDSATVQDTQRVARITNVEFNSGYASNTIKVYVSASNTTKRLIIFKDEEAVDFVEFAAPTVSIHLKTLMAFPDWRIRESNSSVNMPFFWKINDRIAAELSKLVGEHCLVANDNIVSFVESH